MVKPNEKGKNGNKKIVNLVVLLFKMESAFCYVLALHLREIETVVTKSRLLEGTRSNSFQPVPDVLSLKSSSLTEREEELSRGFLKYKKGISFLNDAHLQV